MQPVAQLVAELEQQGMRFWSEDGVLRYRGPQHLLEGPALDQLRIRKGEAVRLLECRNALRLRTPLAKTKRSQSAPLSAIQAAWWTLGFEKQELDHQVTIEIPLSARPDIESVRRAIERVIQRHEILRTVYRTEGGQLRQIVLPDPGVDLDWIDLAGAGRDGAATSLDQDAGGDFRRRRISLENGPVLIGRLVTDVGGSVLLLSFSRLAVDFPSQVLLIRELLWLVQAEKAGETKLPELPIQYADFAIWEQENFQSDAFCPDVKHWPSRLQSVPKTTFVRRQSPPPWRRAELQIPFDAVAAKSLAVTERNLGTDRAVILLAAVNALAAAWCGQSSVAMSLFGREHLTGCEQLIGCFAQLRPLVFDVSDDPKFSDMVQRTAEGLLEAKNPRYPISSTEIAEHNLHRLILNLMRVPTGSPPEAAANASDMRVSARAEFYYEIAVSLTLVGHAVVGTLDFAFDAVDASEAKWFVQAIPALIVHASEAPEAKLSQLLGAIERSGLQSAEAVEWTS